MSVHPLPQPEPNPLDGFGDFFATVLSSFTGIFGEMTIGELVDSVRDVPVRDALNAFIEGAS